MGADLGMRPYDSHRANDDAGLEACSLAHIRRRVDDRRAAPPGGLEAIRKFGAIAANTDRYPGPSLRRPLEPANRQAMPLPADTFRVDRLQQTEDLKPCSASELDQLGREVPGARDVHRARSHGSRADCRLRWLGGRGTRVMVMRQRDGRLMLDTPRSLPAVEQVKGATTSGRERKVDDRFGLDIGLRPASTSTTMRLPDRPGSATRRTIAVARFPSAGVPTAQRAEPGWRC